MTTATTSSQLAAVSSQPAGLPADGCRLPARSVILAYLRDGQPRAMRDLAALAAGEKTELCREDIQYVLRQLIEEGAVRQHAPDADGLPWTYTLKDPLVAAAISHQPSALSLQP
jgi:hypothetical protein